MPSQLPSPEQEERESLRFGSNNLYAIGDSHHGGQNQTNSLIKLLTTTC
jgi:hypothetical protein